MQEIKPKRKDKYRFRVDPNSNYVEFVSKAELPEYVRAKLQKGLNTGRLPEYLAFLSKQIESVGLPREIVSQAVEQLKQK
jgi:hypothetical protein